MKQVVAPSEATTSFGVDLLGGDERGAPPRRHQSGRAQRRRARRARAERRYLRPVSCRASRCPAGTHPHDVAPAADGWMSYASGGVHRPPEPGERRGDPGAAGWVGAARRHHRHRTGPPDHRRRPDAIVRVDAGPREVTVFPLPRRRSRHANLNTATFDSDGILGSPARPASTAASIQPPARCRSSTRRRGAARTASRPPRTAQVYYASLAGSHIARVDTATGAATVIEPPTRSRARVGYGPDSPARSGSASGTRARSASTTRRPARGRSGRCPAPAPGLRGLRRRSRQGLADRLRRQRDRALRPGHRDVTTVALPGTAAKVRQMLGRPGEG